jgi:L,D-peptidoglycan transpeptidase YkuD (ErfK/YbiS/YcfS/YnhG family)
VHVRRHAGPRRRDVQVSRRAVLTGAFGVLAEGKGPSAAAAAHVSIEYRGGSIYWPSGKARAAVGAGGVHPNKTEGDRATPAGTFSLPFGMYRRDRITLPNTDLAMTTLREAHAWVDDPNDPKYNQLVELPYPSHTEEPWRTDGIYDLLVVVGYNMNPTQPGAGSAIFLHIARRDFSPTAGCVAVSRSILLKLVNVLGADSTLTIRE